MITRIQARGFCCLKEVDQDLGEFQALIGPNASGKSTFLDLVTFVSDLLSADGNLEKAVGKRTSNFHDLLWNRRGDGFVLALEVEIPEKLRKNMAETVKEYNHVRYELTVKEMEIHQESLVFITSPKMKDMPQPNLRFVENESAEYLVKDISKQRAQKQKSKTIFKRGAKDNYYPETGKGYKPSVTSDRKFSALARLPAGEKDFPIAYWFRSMLQTGVSNIMLNSRVMKMPSRPGQPREFQSDGSNLPWCVEQLKTQNPENFKRWVRHVRLVLEDLKQIHVIGRKEDGCKRLQIEYQNGIKVPSWTLSDGTLRFLALTLLAYLSLEQERGVYLIEEMENCIHPPALEVMLQSLTSMYESQVLLTTRSPSALEHLELKEILCFSKDNEGAVNIIRGDRHPNLRNKSSLSKGTIFASGMLDWT